MRWLILTIFLFAGCRSVPCSSVEGLAESFEVFWQDHSAMLQRDETLSTEDKQVILEHALTYRRLLEELEGLCDG